MSFKDQALAILQQQHTLSSKYLDKDLGLEERKDIGTHLSSIEHLVPLAEIVLKTLQDLEDNIQDQKDPELSSMAQEEHETLKNAHINAEEQFKMALLPKDPNDNQNAVIEIRAGTGGLEASLFASDVLRMYELYAKNKKWDVNIIDLEETGIEGLTQVILTISSKTRGVYGHLKFESGTHRVQRVPKTESSGRVHTSAITVAVFPEVDQDIDIEIKSDDLRIDTYRSSGAGGQHVNKTDSAVRITHLPSGIVVKSQNQRSQHQNKDTCMKLLKVRLYELELKDQKHAIDKDRKSMVGTGDRSGRIRTYNFPQKRMTDHRIDLTLYQLDSILNGDLDFIVKALQTSDANEQLKNANF